MNDDKIVLRVLYPSERGKEILIPFYKEYFASCNRNKRPPHPRNPENRYCLFISVSAHLYFFRRN